MQMIEMFPLTVRCHSSPGSPGTLLSALAQENGTDSREDCLFNMSPNSRVEREGPDGASTEGPVLSVTAAGRKQHTITKSSQETDAKVFSISRRSHTAVPFKNAQFKV